MVELPFKNHLYKPFIKAFNSVILLTSASLGQTLLLFHTFNSHFMPIITFSFLDLVHFQFRMFSYGVS